MTDGTALSQVQQDNVELHSSPLQDPLQCLYHIRLRRDRAPAGAAEVLRDRRGVFLTEHSAGESTSAPRPRKPASSPLLPKVLMPAGCVLDANPGRIEETYGVPATT